MRTRLTLALAIAALASGCLINGGGEPFDAGADDGAAGDAAAADAGQKTEDAGSRADAGGGSDAAVDAGSHGGDAGGTADAGQGRDAGSRDDAGSSADANAPPADAGPSADAGGGCQDTCPAPHGLTWDCKKRFALGTNWAWHDFGADFGGIAVWNKSGVAGDVATFQVDLTAMTAKKARTIRWWMFPRFRTESIAFDSNDVPTGIGGTLVADIQKALELAEQNDVYLMLTLFSFDSFKDPDKAQESSLPHVRQLQPYVRDAAKGKKLLENVIGPVADAVQASPYRHRVFAWDLFNEPEWAMTGPNKYGGPNFEPQANVTNDPVTHSEIEPFVSDLIATLRSHSSAQITLGCTAIKWASAWKHVDLDFYQLHYYDWIYEWFPYKTVTPATEGLTDKPVIMGEFPNSGLSAISSKGLPARTASEFASDLWDQGYAGALSWAYTDAQYPWSALDLATFADRHACETRF